MHFQSSKCQNRHFNSFTFYSFFFFLFFFRRNKWNETNVDKPNEKYSYSPHYWHVFAARLAFVVVFEVCLDVRIAAI